MSEISDVRTGEQPILVESVGASFGGNQEGGNGKLEIFPGRIELRSAWPMTLLNRVSHVTQETRDVLLLRARLVPPWFNVALVVRGVDLAGTAVLPIWKRKSLRLALERSGFRIVERDTWFSLGAVDARRGTVPTGSLASSPFSWRRRMTLLRWAILAVGILIACGALMLVLAARSDSSPEASRDAFIAWLIGLVIGIIVGMPIGRAIASGSPIPAFPHWLLPVELVLFVAFIVFVLLGVAPWFEHVHWTFSLALVGGTVMSGALNRDSNRP